MLINRNDMRCKVVLRAEIQADVPASEILELVTPETLLRIKKQDPSPEIRLYAVGHEGETTPNLLGTGKIAMRWMQEAIVKLFGKVRMSLPVFHRHGATNDHWGRTQVGEVVGKSLKYMNNRLYSLAAVWVYPVHKAKPLDVASIESELEFARDGNTGFRVCDVVDVTGIALSNSAVDKPAFAGATLLGAVAAFEKSHSKREGGDMELTLDEVKAAVAELKVKPSELFDEPALRKDEVVVKIEQGAHKDWKEQFEHRKRTDEAFTKARSEWDTKERAMNAQLLTLQRNTLFTDVAKARKLDDRQVKFLEKTLPRMEIGDNPAKAREVVDAWVTEGLKEFDSFQEMFGGKKDKAPGSEGSNDGKKAEDQPAANRFENPKENELIPA